jgi:hypothetical protein
MRRYKFILVFVVGTILAGSSGCKKPSSDPDGITEIKYEVSNEIFPNPERGFMHLFDVTAEGEGLDPSRLNALRNENVTLIQRMYYFEKFKKAPLSEIELTLIQSDMQKVRNAGMKCILCFAYTGLDYVYNTEKGEDAPYSSIEEHLDQLKPVFEENQDIIAFIQAGFIGPWGEWHSSTNGLETTYYKTKVLDKMLSVIPVNIMVQVRTPGYKQEIFGTSVPVSEEIAYTDDKRARVGHYNDCFMASADDYGTYTNIAADKEYISNEALFVPTGGETCPPVPDDYPTGCSIARSTMRQLRWTYLNLDWYQPTLDGWRISGCFDEFQRDLGYRLALTSASIPTSVEQDHTMQVNIAITNKGFAPLYNFKNTFLVLKEVTSGDIHQVSLQVDIRDCKPLAQFSIEETVDLTGIPPGDYKLYLKISDRSENLQNRKEYSVRLANTNTWTEENGGMNDLKYQLTIGSK